MLSRIIFIIYILFINYTISIYSQEDNQLNNTLEWNSVKSSKGYSVQIRNKAKKLIIDEKILENTYIIKLPEGNYEHRIGVYNKFGKVSAYSEWEPFQIKRVYDPEVLEKLYEINNDGSNKEIHIKGNNFTPDTKIFFKSDDNKIDVENIKFINEKEIEVQITPEKNQLGSYDLILINPRNKKIIIKNYLNLLKPVEVVKNIESKPTEREMISDTTKPLSYKIKNGLRSAVLPGWGQFHDDRRLKGILFSTIFIGGALYIGNKYSDYKKSKEQYESDTNQGLLLGSLTGQGAGALVIYNYASSTANYSNTIEKANHITQVGLGLQIFYLYNIIDNFLVPDKDLSPKPGLSLFTDYKTQNFAPGLPINSQFDFGLKFTF